MKYLLFWEQEGIDPEERARISRRAREERRDEERYGRVVLPRARWLSTGKSKMAHGTQMGFIR